MSQILVIDDDITIQLTLQRTLQKHGYTVTTAANGEDGVAKALELLPEVIICDWMMPGLKGPQVCRQIKAHPRLKSTFFILLTAFDTTEDLVRGFDAGADDFLIKPPKITELRARIRAGLRASELNRTLQQTTEQLTSEWSKAADYLHSLLPDPLSGLIATQRYYRPCSMLAADAFATHWLTPDDLMLAIWDISGRGMEAVCQSIQLQEWFKYQSLPEIDYSDPASVVSALNWQVQDSKQVFLTLWYGCFHRPTQTLTYCSSGHPPALLTTSEGDVEELATPAPPLGVFAESDYYNSQCTVAPGDGLLLYTDGIYQIALSSGGRWQRDKFVDLWSSIRRSQGPQPLQLLIDQVEDRRQEPEFMDDVALLFARF